MKVSGQVHSPATLQREKGPRYPLDGRLGGFPDQCGRYGEEKNLLPLLGVESRLLGSQTKSTDWAIPAPQ
jgi:hypothetical protein